jgi:hypothetical protein
MPSGASPKNNAKATEAKKKRHTQKFQLVVDTKTKQILATAFSDGKKHDFKLFGKSRTALLP